MRPERALIFFFFSFDKVQYVACGAELLARFALASKPAVLTAVH